MSISFSFNLLNKSRTFQRGIRPRWKDFSDTPSSPQQAAGYSGKVRDKDKLSLVTIIGRVNVGKSTLFNRILEEHKALVSEVPRTTRDLNYGEVFWRGTNFILVDTGGLKKMKNLSRVKSRDEKLKIKNYIKFKNIAPAFRQDNGIEQQVEKMARKALDNSDIILFLVDTKEGLLPQDREIAKILLKSKKFIILVANKCDHLALRDQVSEFYKLGLGQPIPISAANGSGVGDLLDLITYKLKNLKTKRSFIPRYPSSSFIISISIIGKPNVGKSSLLNALLGEERVIVFKEPFTTREPQDTLINYKGQNLLLIDTVGIRKKPKISKESLEKEGVNLSLKALKKSKIALLVLEINKPLTSQDLRLSNLILKSDASLILVANKFDLVKKEERTRKEYESYIYQVFSFLDFAPVIFISAKTGERVKKILDLILEVKEGREKQIPESKLNEFLKEIIKKKSPPQGKLKKKRAFISKIIQIQKDPPLFQVKVTGKKTLPVHYLKYIENQIREKFKFLGAPIRIKQQTTP